MKKIITLIVMSTLWVGTSSALQIAPTYQMFNVKPGEKVKGQCLLTNDEQEKLIIQLSSKDWFVLPQNSAFKAKDWLTFKDTKLSLDPGQSQSITFFVEAPKKAQGELAGMVSYSFTGELPTNLQKVLSVAIYATVSGTEKLKGNLKDLMITPSTGALAVSLLIENKGNVHIRPEGWCEIRDEKAELVANIFIKQGPPVYPGKEYVYSGQVREFQLKAGSYKALIRISDVDRNTEIVRVTKKFDLLENNSVDMR